MQRCQTAVEAASVPRDPKGVAIHEQLMVSIDLTDIGFDDADPADRESSETVKVSLPIPGSIGPLRQPSTRN